MAHNENSLRVVVNQEKRVEDPMEKMLFTLTGLTSVERKRYKTKSIKFSQKLMYILECGDYKDLIVWKPNGLSFDITDPKVFEKKVLRGICEGIKFSTFQRKLSRWSFIKKKRIHSYCHPDFRRGDWIRCSAMRTGHWRQLEKKWHQCLSASSFSIWQFPSHMSNVPSIPSLVAVSITSDGLSTVIAANYHESSSTTAEEQKMKFTDTSTPVFVGSNAGKDGADC